MVPHGAASHFDVLGECRKESCFMERLWSGTFECPDCGIEYEADADPESELICEECDQPLIPVDDDADDESNEEEAA
jgi:hypothetical protein